MQTIARFRSGRVRGTYEQAIGFRERRGQRTILIGFQKWRHDALALVVPCAYRAQVIGAFVVRPEIDAEDRGQCAAQSATRGLVICATAE